MQPIVQHVEAIVIGGGLTGLAAAALIARQGKRVCLFEQAHTLGGRARTRAQQGFSFNLGAHALYRGGRGIDILTELGVAPQGGCPSTAGAYAIKGGVKHTYPAGPVSLLTTSLLTLPAKLEVARLLGSLGTLDASQWMGTSLQEWADIHVAHPDARDVLLAGFRVATYTNAPDLVSAGAAIEQLQKALAKNVLYLHGGWQTLVDGLRQAAVRAGVSIETGAKTVAIERNVTGAVCGVRLADGRVPQAPAVVIATSPAVAAALTENWRSAALHAWAASAIPVQAACLDVALRRLPQPHATVAFGVDHPLYLSVHSAVARLAPEGSALLHTLVYLPPEHTRSPEDDERELDTLLDLVQSGWRELVVQRQFLPRMTVMHDMPTARRGGTRGRPGPQVPDVPGLFVVGDWVGQEGLLADASLASAKEAAEIITCSAPMRRTEPHVVAGRSL
jgi:phytoene dehydrogenase-like protein